MNCSPSCIKINNPIRNLLLPTIIFVFLDKAFAYIFYATLFKDVWMPYASLWRPMELSNYWFFGMSAAGAFYAFLISFFYAWTCNLAKKQICIFGFSFAVFLVSRFSGEIYDYLMYPYNTKMMFLGMSHGFFTLTSWAFISKKIFVIQNKN